MNTSDNLIPVEVSSVEIEVEIEDEPPKQNKVLDNARNLSASLHELQLFSSKSDARLTFVKELRDLTTNMPVSEDIRHGYKILQHLMAPALKKVNSIFISRLGPEARASSFFTPGTQCLTLPQMKEKFEASEYASLIEFIKDARDMFLGYIRYHGPEHSAAGLCEKLETILQQRVALLPRAYKEMCALENTHRSYLKTSEWSTRSVRQVSQTLSSTLIQRLRQEAKEMGKEEKKRQMAQREKERESLKHELACWDSVLFGDKMLEQMLSSWELPQIGLFLYLCQAPLNCGTVNQCEVERMMLLCKESQAMARVMTSLLSTPHQRQYLHRRPPMPYHIWSDKLCDRLQAWYKILEECEGDHSQASDIIGIEAMFWRVVGMLRNPLRYQPFYKLTFYQRIWIVKSLCDSCTSSHASLREAIEEQTPEDTRSFVLGADSSGATYINFPQFCGDTLRIYRIRTKKKAGRKRMNQEVASEEPTRTASPIDVCSVLAEDKPSLPKSRLSPPPSNRAISAKISRAERLARRSVKFEDWRAFKYLESSTSLSSRDPTPTSDSCLPQPITNQHPSTSEPTLKSESSSVDTPSIFPHLITDELKQVNDLDNSHTNDQNKQSDTCSMSTADYGELGVDTISSLHDDGHDRFLYNMHVKDEKVEVSSANDDDTTGSQSYTESVANESSTSISNECKAGRNAVNVKVESAALSSDAVANPNVTPEKGLLLESPDMETYRLVCQSVEELRNLCSSFDGGRGKEVELHAELEKLVEELTPFESKLIQLEQKCKEGLRKEQDSYVEPAASLSTQGDKGWATEGEEEESIDEDGTVGESREYVTTGRERRERRERRAEAANAQELEAKESELGESLFGRRRKRRVIPNNTVTELFSKKPRKDRVAETTNGAIDNNTLSSAVTDSPGSSTRVKVPEGFVMVKIHKEIYLVRKEQLPALLAKTGAMHIQVVTQAVKVVNPQAVKAIQSLHTSTSPCQTKLVTSQQGMQLLTKQAIRGDGADCTLSSDDKLKSSGLATDLPNTLFTVGARNVSSNLSKNSPLKFTLNSSSDPLGLSRQNTVRPPLTTILSQNLWTPNKTSIMTSPAGSMLTNVSTHVTKESTTGCEQQPAIAGLTVAEDALGKKIFVNDTQRTQTELQSLEIATHSPKTELQNTKTKPQLTQSNTQMVCQILPARTNENLHSVASHITVKGNPLILGEMAGFKNVAIATSKPTIITSPSISQLGEGRTTSATSHCVSIESPAIPQLFNTIIRAPRAAAAGFLSLSQGAKSAPGLMSKSIVSVPRAWTVVRCTSSNSLRQPIRITDASCSSMGALSTAETVPGFGSVVVQRGQSRVTMRSHSIVASQEKKTSPGQTVISSRPTPRPVFLLTHPKLNQPSISKNIIVSSATNVTPSNTICSIVSSKAKTVTTVTQATTKATQLMVSSQALKHIPVAITNGSAILPRPGSAVQQLRLVNGVPQVNAAISTVRVVTPLNTVPHQRVRATLQNGTVILQQNTKGNVIRLSTTNQLRAGAERLVVVKKPNGSYSIPSSLSSIRSQPTQIVLPSQTATSNSDSPGITRP